jgi:Na+/H+ antiporter NhaD/arsenite permease-like protein
MSHAHALGGSSKPLVAVILAIVAIYVLALAAGLPQRGTAIANAGQNAYSGPSADGPGRDHGTAAEPKLSEHPPLVMVVPFVLILLAIAVLPLVPFTAPWWESNLHRFYVAATLGGITLLYYLFLHEMPVIAHWPWKSLVWHNSVGPNFAVMLAVLANAMLYEYVPFIVLLFSLYTITGGIRIEGDLRAHPLTNATFLAVGGLLASFIGTTGAAMLLIRPLLETNRERRHVAHTVVIFIFIVCNCGGCLLPIGDPPLFLGYLFGVPFLWTFQLWKEWLFVNGLLIVLYYLWDRFWHYPRERKPDLLLDEFRTHRLRFAGIWPNAPLLAGVVLSVALLDPGKALPGTEFHPPLYLREVAQLTLVAISLVVGSKSVRRANRFNYHAIVEVAVLFFGIFLAMQPPLEILAVRGDQLGLKTPASFFWSSGSLSSVLDNAPTYVVFFETARAETARSLPAVEQHVVAGVEHSLLAALSLGAVFMGAMTYIGNGPNFMVKSIAEASGVRMPSFFGYLAYSGGILLPLLVLMTLIFL